MAIVVGLPHLHCIHTNHLLDKFWCVERHAEAHCADAIVPGSDLCSWVLKQQQAWPSVWLGFSLSSSTACVLQHPTLLTISWYVFIASAFA